MDTFFTESIENNDDDFIVCRTFVTNVVESGDDDFYFN
ncbi:hypothetical protein ECDEC2B_5336 [Escherichia coli DEC2B]|nr:hypothetical protein EC236275_3020 [Escherichia coli 2362-75]EHU03381.1 hypothetical protein ECDEC1B_5405 [Escherichia coli DEC1B]EHU16404.1 hypothetical protein ECDEC1A_5213 [Escherichia coli DEC1A]EHU17319.1 hypothetical protein ECDEC1C_5361 [Escherichia coli DEC1C]EHU22982.1 hypothetical protein ECDEC1D_2682 [Escherichia coli DEC1D]EHU27208.1 hypothetical protein ECDEC1E_2369 [Escherichia coli DEC1E]EHU33390.1 hypothetical protein ECDEC2B_5336 [Escherichia coli DEC2B]EHU34558.1 hypothe